MTEIEIEMMAILYFKDCWDDKYAKIKEFVFNNLYYEITWKWYKIKRQEYYDVINYLTKVRYMAEDNIKNNRKLYLALIK